MATSSVSILFSSSAISASKALARWASEDSDALVAAVTGSADRPGRNPAHSATDAVTLSPFNWEWSWSGALYPRWRI